MLSHSLSSSRRGLIAVSIRIGRFSRGRGKGVVSRFSTRLPFIRLYTNKSQSSKQNLVPHVLPLDDRCPANSSPASKHHAAYCRKRRWHCIVRMFDCSPLRHPRPLPSILVSPPLPPSHPP